LEHIDEIESHDRVASRPYPIAAIEPVSLTFTDEESLELEEPTGDQESSEFGMLR